MGGCLALRLAEVHGSAVRGLVVVNPSLAPDTKLFLLAPVLKHVLRSLPGNEDSVFSLRMAPKCRSIKLAAKDCCRTGWPLSTL